MKKSFQPNAQTPIITNLLALRRLIIRVILGMVVCTAMLVPVMQEIFDFVCAPLIAELPDGTQMMAVGVVSPILCPLKITIFSAFCLTLPFTLLQLWGFIAPALYPREKRTALPFILSCVVMFASGMAYCYFVVFGFVFSFIASFAPGSVNFAPDIDAYISFLLHMFLAFGIAFETPIAVFLIVRSGVSSVDTLKHLRRYIIVGAFVLAAVLTPPDVTSQLLLALPLVILYELGIIIASLTCRKNANTIICSSKISHTS